VDETSRQILAIEPRVWHGRSGWLAVSTPGSVLNVGVVGETEETARAAFRDELEAWCRLHESRMEATT
jgi:hypothetical protein